MLSAKKEAEDEAVVPAEFECPILHELMTDPVFTSDGHTYERTAISRWLDGGHDTSPLTGKLLPSTVLVPNHALRKAIANYRALRASTKRKAEQDMQKVLDSYKEATSVLSLKVRKIEVEAEESRRQRVLVDVEEDEEEVEIKTGTALLGSKLDCERYQYILDRQEAIVASGGRHSDNHASWSDFLLLISRLLKTRTSVLGRESAYLSAVNQTAQRECSISPALLRVFWNDRTALADSGLFCRFWKEQKRFDWESATAIVEVADRRKFEEKCAVASMKMCKVALMLLESPTTGKSNKRKQESASASCTSTSYSITLPASSSSSSSSGAVPEGIAKRFVNAVDSFGDFPYEVKRLLAPTTNAEHGHNKAHSTDAALEACRLVLFGIYADLASYCASSKEIHRYWLEQRLRDDTTLSKYEISMSLRKLQSEGKIVIADDAVYLKSTVAAYSVY